jgi:hypothetical protein
MPSAGQDRSAEAGPAPASISSLQFLRRERIAGFHLRYR